MIQLNWREQPLDIHRLVFWRGHERSLDAILDRLAVRFRLAVADERADPQSGDFWIDCHLRGSGVAPPPT